MDVRVTSFRRIALGLALLLLAGCGGLLSDGGVGGTGIATVRGNVVDPDITAMRTGKAAGNEGGGATAEGITVRVRGTDVQDITNQAGEFELTGAIAGDITLEFLRDDRPVAATLRLLVPVDAEVTLNNVELVNDTAEPEVIRVIVDGMIAAAATCDAEGGEFVLRDEANLEFTVSISNDDVACFREGSLTPGTNLCSSDGECADDEICLPTRILLRGVQRRLECEDLSPVSNPVTVFGFQSGSEIIAQEIVVSRSGNEPSL